MEAEGYDLLPWQGWPLRPFYFPRASLEALAGQLVRTLRSWACDSQSKAPEELAGELGLKAEALESLDYQGAFSEPSFTGFLRPDGFLYPHSYTVVELNFGNGLLVSQAYADLLAEYHTQDPRLASELKIPRPFERYLDYLQSLVDEKIGLVGILACASEYETIMSWEKRVGDMVRFGQELFHRRGWQTVILHEDDVEVVPGKKALSKALGQELDLIVPLTINTTFFDSPELLRTRYRHWTGSRVGRTPFFSPLSALCVDKGTLPWLTPHLASGGDFSVEIPFTEPPTEERMREYRLNREDWVLKRAFDGKDTHVGCSSHGRVWNERLAYALRAGGYVLQRYQSMPTTIVPVTPDGESIEWLEVSFELSPFLVDNAFAGGIVRYAPKAEGLIMSPPPENMGLGVAVAV